MKIDCRTALILRHPSEKKVLLLKRAPFKKIFPNLITGIGGKVEFEKGEAEDLEKSLLRELSEETHIDRSLVSDLKLRLATILLRDGEEILLLWYLGRLTQVPPDLQCNEGALDFYSIDNLPLDNFTPTAAKAIPFILEYDDEKIFNGVFKEDGTLLVNI